MCTLFSTLSSANEFSISSPFHTTHNSAYVAALISTDIRSIHPTIGAANPPTNEATQFPTEQYAFCAAIQSTVETTNKFSDNSTDCCSFRATKLPAVMFPEPAAYGATNFVTKCSTLFLPYETTNDSTFKRSISTTNELSNHAT